MVDHKETFYAFWRRVGKGFKKLNRLLLLSGQCALGISAEDHMEWNNLRVEFCFS